MPDLARRIGLGLAARGSLDDVTGWAGRAAAMGLESVWIHDSYFERDAVTYATAIAARVPEIGVGLGALNPSARVGHLDLPRQTDGAGPRGRAALAREARQGLTRGPH